MSPDPASPAPAVLDAGDATTDLLDACRVLEHEGLTTAFGHVSARVGEDRVLVSGNVGPGLVRTPSDLVTTTLDGEVVDGDAALLPGEVAIHLGLYRARPEVASVCRFHGPSCMAWGTLGRALPATIGMGLFLGHEVPWFDTARTVVTAEQGDALAATTGRAQGVLLRGFGAAVVGATVRESTVRAWLLERSATAVLAASAVVAPLPYTAADAEPFLAGEGAPVQQVARAWHHLTTISDTGATR